MNCVWLAYIEVHSSCTESCEDDQSLHRGCAGGRDFDYIRLRFKYLDTIGHTPPPLRTPPLLPPGLRALPILVVYMGVCST